MNARTEPAHVPVLVERVTELLAPALREPDAVVVDATLGLGGHAERILREHDHVRVVGLDRDPDALALARRRLAPFGDRVTVERAVYDELPRVLDRLGLQRVAGVLFDLGVSSLQLDEPARGFAYSRDVPLDMRMDPTTGRTAADVLNTYSASELTRIFRVYGEEPHARRIADAVVRARRAEPLRTSGQLVELIRGVVRGRHSGGHPAKRTFQALRIEVNAELTTLERALPAALDALAVGGRIVVLSYHSLEDRLVKRTLGALAQPDVPPGLPVVPPEHEPVLRLLTRGAEKPTPAEVQRNPRAASARLRAAERIREGRRTVRQGGAG
nr:16S rRNA (cytosine(1402)-N(4))-methyltransferase RsmH [Thermasporomyces composti]